MWFFYLFILVFNMFYSSRFVNKKYEKMNDVQSGFICSGPGEVMANEGGPNDDDPELPELP